MKLKLKGKLKQVNKDIFRFLVLIARSKDVFVFSKLINSKMQVQIKASKSVFLRLC